MLIEREKSCLLVVDVQERLAPAMAEREAAVRNCAILMKAAARLGVPVVVSEQYPQGLGPTIPELKALAPAEAFLAKTSFSCAGDPGLAARLRALGRKQIVIAGMEAHVCVLQSALGLAQAGYDCFVAADATASRAPANKEAALARLREDGVRVVTTEMAVFEWLGRAATDELREVSRLIK
jgi:nicotinamidase-related amidase